MERQARNAHLLPLNIKLDPRKRYRWVNVENKVNLYRREAEGWEPVNPTTANTEIQRRGDLVLMQISEEKAERLRQQKRERYEAAYSSSRAGREFAQEVRRLTGRDLAIEPDKVHR